MTADPLTRLGLGPDATAPEVAEARRRLAREHHPDRGGDVGQMRAINAAADAALADIERRRVRSESSPAETPSTPAASGTVAGDDPGTAAGTGAADRGAFDEDVVESGRVARDVPSFTVEALPAVTFEALLIATATLGDLLDDEPPNRLDAYLRAPYDCWCRLDVVPDAGAATVSLTVAGIDGVAAPPLTVVRDAWVAALNSLDWP